MFKNVMKVCWKVIKTFIYSIGILTFVIFLCAYTYFRVTSPGFERILIPLKEETVIESFEEYKSEIEFIAEHLEKNDNNLITWYEKTPDKFETHSQEEGYKYIPVEKDTSLYNCLYNLKEGNFRRIYHDDNAIFFERWWRLGFTQGIVYSKVNPMELPGINNKYNSDIVVKETSEKDFYYYSYKYE